MGYSFDDLTLEGQRHLVKVMKLTKIQIERLCRTILSEMTKQNIVTYKAPEDKVFRRAVELIQGEYEKEKALEREATAMVDDLDRKSPGSFERHKMYLMIKQQLAKQKGVIL